MDNLNQFSVAQSLFDACGNIDTIIKDLESSDYSSEEDLFSFAVFYDVVINCMCRSWHYRWMLSDMIGRLDQDDFERIVVRIPLWDKRFELVSVVPDISDDVVDERAGAKKAVAMLRGAQKTLAQIGDLAEKTDTVDVFDRECIQLYCDAVISLCRAWEICFGGFAINKRNQDMTDRAIIHIPDWGFMLPYRLVELTWRFGGAKGGGLRGRESLFVSDK